ncbi:MAG: RNA polymerase sigma factor [Bacteroidales bacterium]|nr:RNA polymerase sigma factor [Bacteroidales bacterium]
MRIEMNVEEFKRDVLPVKNKLYRFALKLLRSTTEAEDTVQEVFLKLWSKKETLVNYNSIEAFAMVMTKNLCLDKLKSPKSKTKEILDTDMKVSDRTPENYFEMKDNIKYVHRIIASLPDQQKMIIQLRDVEGYEYEEIAEIMQMNRNAIRVNLSRARKTVRDELVKKYNYEYIPN